MSLRIRRLICVLFVSRYILSFENTPIQIYWNFTTKNWMFSIKILIFFSYFCSKHRLWVLVRTASAVREKSRECHNHKPQPFLDTKRKRKRTNPNKHKSNKRTKSTKISSLFPKWGNRNAKRTEKRVTHNLPFWAEIRKIVYPCKPQFYCIKKGFKGTIII